MRPTMILGAAALLAASCTERNLREAETETFSDQAIKGAVLYTSNCSKCHGTLGQGTEKAPRLVGMDKGALPLAPRPEAKKRTMEFRTAADIAKFVVKNMPANDPGKLSEHDYFRVLAFALRANGVDLDGKHLDMSLAEQTVIHPEGEAPPAPVSTR